MLGRLAKCLEKPSTIVSSLRTWKFPELPFVITQKTRSVSFLPFFSLIKFCRRAIFGRRLSPCRRKASPSGDCARILHRAVSACSRYLSSWKRWTRRSGVSLSARKSLAPLLSPPLAASKVLREWVKRKPEQAYGKRFLEVLDKQSVNRAAALKFRDQLLISWKSGEWNFRHKRCCFIYICRFFLKVLLWNQKSRTRAWKAYAIDFWWCLTKTSQTLSMLFVLYGHWIGGKENNCVHLPKRSKKFKWSFDFLFSFSSSSASSASSTNMHSSSLLTGVSQLGADYTSRGQARFFL